MAWDALSCDALSREVKITSDIFSRVAHMAWDVFSRKANLCGIICLK